VGGNSVCVCVCVCVRVRVRACGTVCVCKMWSRAEGCVVMMYCVYLRIHNVFLYKRLMHV